MEHFIGPKALLWQKLAVKVERDVATDELLLNALRCGASFLHIECGLYTAQECTALLDRCNEIIKTYMEECKPWNVAVGIICELSGPRARVQFVCSERNPVQVLEQQRITLTADVRYGNQCFDEVKYVTNYDQLQQRVSIGDVLSIGPVKLTVERILTGFITCRATHAGFIKPFSIVQIDCEEKCPHKQLEYEMSSTLEELERVVEKGCKFIIVPQMSAKSLCTFVESITSREQIQIIAHAFNMNDESDQHQCIDAFVAKDVVLLKQAKSTGKAVLYNVESEQTSLPETIEQADVIIATISDVTRIQDYLRHVNSTQLEALQLTKRTLHPDEGAMATCLNFSAQETNASAIILPLGKENARLAIEISLTNPHCIVLILHPSGDDLNRILLRKCLVPIIVPKPVASANVSQQKLIRRAIAYGRRFGYLHDGNCIVTGYTVNSDTDELGMETRYVPLESP